MDIDAYAINEIGGTAEPFLYETKLGSRDVLVKITSQIVLSNTWRTIRSYKALAREYNGQMSARPPWADGDRGLVYAVASR